MNTIFKTNVPLVVFTSIVKRIITPCGCLINTIDITAALNYIIYLGCNSVMFDRVSSCELFHL